MYAKPQPIVVCVTTSTAIAATKNACAAAAAALAHTHLDDFLGAKEGRRARGKGDPKQKEKLRAAELRLGPDHLVQHFHVLWAQKTDKTQTDTTRTHTKKTKPPQTK